MMMRIRALASAFIVFSLTLVAGGAFAQTTDQAADQTGGEAAPAATGGGGAAGYTPFNADGQIEVVLKDHKFDPSEIHVAPGKPVQLLVSNQDETADEFDSTALRVEKVIGGGSQGIVRLRGLKPGRYPFMGEFHADTAQGVVIVE